MIAVTGATGQLGGRVAQALAEQGLEQRLVVRDAARAPQLAGAEVAVAQGYRDRFAMTAALRGAHTLFLVSGREAADRVEEHRSVVDAAVDAGVSRIVYTSFLGAAPDATFTFARDHAATEEHIRATGRAFTFLRDSLYLDYVPLLASPDGVIAGPAGDGRVAPVARDDVADAAVAVLAADGAHDGETYALTGPEALTVAELAEALGRVAGREITYVDETLEEAYASRAHYGAPQFEVDGWVTSYLMIAKGEVDTVSDGVPQLTGHPATGVAEWLERNPASWAHLQA